MRNKKVMKITLIASALVFVGVLTTIILTKKDTSKAQETSTEVSTVIKDIVTVDEEGTIRDAVTGKELTKEEVKDLTEKGVIEKTEDGTVKVNEEKNSQTVTVTTDDKGDIIEAKTESGKDITTTAKENETEYTTTKTTTEDKTESTKNTTTENTTEATTEKKTTEKKTESTTETTTEKKTTTEEQPFIELPTEDMKCLHDYKCTVTEATCEKDGKRVYKCTICGNTYSETIKATGHHFNLVNTVEATCTTDGKKTYKCSCGKTKSEVIKATGHNYKCTVTEATCDKDGKKVYKCSKCGDTYSETIPSGNHSWGETWEEEDYHEGSYTEVIHFILDDGTDITALGWTIEDWMAHEDEIGESHAYYTKYFYHWTSDNYTIIYTYHKCSKCGKTELVDTQIVYYHRAGDVSN